MAFDSAIAMTAATYDTAADSYDDAANSFWSRFGRRTIDRLELAPGASVLDVCCGSGASAIPAAEAVGPSGRVLGVDVAQKLLDLAQTKARQRRLAQLEFRRGDFLALDMPASAFDAVVCVFGLFFVPDMAAAARSLWRLLRPGGTLAITSWGQDFFEPASTVFWESIARVRPELYKSFQPWDRICEPALLSTLLEKAGIEDAHVVQEFGEHRIASPECWWQAVLGSGYRGTYEQLNAADREFVREYNLSYIRDNEVRSVQANVIYARAVKRADR